MVKMVKITEKGFTLLEALIAVAIMAIVVGAIAMATTTILLNHGQAAEQNAVLPQVQNAGHWISRDVQTARNVTATAPNGFPLSLRVPIDTNQNNDYSVNYTFNGTRLKRKVYDSSQTLVSETLIADYIDTGNTTFNTLNATLKLYQLTVRAVKDKGGVTRIYEVSQRIATGSGG